MKITIQPQAAKWFKDEVGLPESYGIRFLPKVYGQTPVQEGFSLGIESAPMLTPGAVSTADNDVTFFVEADDLWFFDGHDLLVDFDEALHEPKYIYLKDGQPINE